MSLLLGGCARERTTLGAMEIREIHEDELGRCVEAMRAGLDEADTADGYLDWKRQSRETV